MTSCRTADFQTGVKGAAWEDQRRPAGLSFSIRAKRWKPTMLVSAVGMFNDRGMARHRWHRHFREERSFHSASWNWEHDLSGRDVAVIGSAASAVQFVPEIVKEANRVYLFQRTANWVMPKEDEPHSKEILDNLQANPGSAEVMRSLIYQGVDEGMTFSNPEAVAELEASVIDLHGGSRGSREFASNCGPSIPFGCKRPLLSNDYFDGFQSAEPRTGD